MYGIIRMEKHQASSVGSMQYHNDRVRGNHLNPDIDPTRSHLNVEYVSHGNYMDEINERIKSGYTGKRAVRKDAVLLVEGIVTASPEFFENKSSDEIAQYFHDCFDFCRKEFSDENLVHFTVHMDETTPHAHFGFVPLKNGSLAWKNYFDGKRDLQAFQDRFYSEVSSRYGLERGEVDTGVKHKTLKELKAETQAELTEQQQRLEYLRQRVELLEPVAAAIEREKGAGSLNYGAVCREIIETCDTARADIEGRIEQIRARISELKERMFEPVVSFSERMQHARDVSLNQSRVIDTRDIGEQSR